VKKARPQERAACAAYRTLRGVLEPSLSVTHHCSLVLVAGQLEGIAHSKGVKKGTARYCHLDAESVVGVAPIQSATLTQEKAKTFQEEENRSESSDRHTERRPESPKQDN